MAADTWLAASTAPDAAISLARVEIERFILASSQSLLSACSPRRAATAGAVARLRGTTAMGWWATRPGAGGLGPPAVAAPDRTRMRAGFLKAPWHIRRQTRLTGDSENALPGAFIRNVPNQTGYITRATSLFMPTGWHGRLNGAPVTALALSCSFTPPGGEAGGATRKQVSSAEENGRKKTYPAAADEPLGARRYKGYRSVPNTRMRRPGEWRP